MCAKTMRKDDNDRSGQNIIGSKEDKNTVLMQTNTNYTFV